MSSAAQLGERAGSVVLISEQTTPSWQLYRVWMFRLQDSNREEPLKGAIFVLTDFKTKVTLNQQLEGLVREYEHPEVGQTSSGSLFEIDKCLGPHTAFLLVGF
ncbi:hypothetical protein RRG08_048464 [Elysia crispata]|uniref:Uncharacterized protein n=1 Tax=Elysia crispata TaxID=231223 RepID=A0AAE1B976_9GAST|nr:hypothetical protein RRG08_048464 [Elysia crispata]